MFIAFDCVYHGRRDLRPRPLCDRRAELDNDVVAGAAVVYPSLRLEGRGALERIVGGARRRITPTCAADSERWHDIVWLKPRVVVEVT